MKKQDERLLSAPQEESQTQGSAPVRAISNIRERLLEILDEMVESEDTAYRIDLRAEARKLLREAAALREQPEAL